jgi:hypothetical protein
MPTRRVSRRSTSSRMRRRLRDTSSLFSTNTAEVEKFGIDTANIFGFWDWIGLSTMIAVAPEHFRAMLSGFHAMDEHFRNTLFERNLPALMAILRARSPAGLPHGPSHHTGRSRSVCWLLDHASTDDVTAYRRHSLKTCEWSTTMQLRVWGRGGELNQTRLVPLGPGEAFEA